MTAGQYVDAATNYKKTRGIASNNHRNEYIGSFEVRKDARTELWYLKVNEDRLIGTKFPTQKEALAVLHGLFTGMDAKKDGMNAIINRMVSQGRGIIDADKATQTLVLRFGNDTSNGFQEGGKAYSSTGDNILSPTHDGTTIADSGTTDWWTSGGNKLRLFAGNYMQTVGPLGSATSVVQNGSDDIYKMSGGTSAENKTANGLYFAKFTATATATVRRDGESSFAAIPSNGATHDGNAPQSNSGQSSLDLTKGGTGIGGSAQSFYINSDLNFTSDNTYGFGTYVSAGGSALSWMDLNNDYDDDFELTIVVTEL